MNQQKNDIKACKYGFIGLGDQGAPIARRMIDNGLSVVLWARRSASLEPFANTASETAESLEDLASKVDYVGICVVDDHGVWEVCSKLIPALKPGSVVAIHSTVSPELCQTLALEAAAKGVHLLDAPVSGGSPAAAAGKLTTMVGGNKEVFESVSNVFETFSGLLIHLGDVGAGQKAKLINNALLAANMGLAYSALAAAASLSLDKDAFIKLVNSSSGRSFGFEVCARLPKPSAFQHGASLLAKDVALLGDTLKGHRCFQPIESTALLFLNAALNADSGELM